MKLILNMKNHGDNMKTFYEEIVSLLRKEVEYIESYETDTLTEKLTINSLLTLEFTYANRVR